MKENITIMGFTFEVENVAYEDVKPMPKVKIKDMECSCCGRECRGRQWWNRDTGYGLCNRCADSFSEKEGEEEMERCYGKKGVHYYIEE